MGLKFIAKREEVVKRYSEFSCQLTTQCRTLSAGILALIWGLLTAKESPFKDANGAIDDLIRWNLISVALLIVVALFLDALQYTIALKVEEGWLDKVGRDDAGTYDDNLIFKLQDVAFWSKLAVMGFAILWLILLLCIRFLGRHKP